MKISIRFMLLTFLLIFLMFVGMLIIDAKLMEFSIEDDFTRPFILATNSAMVEELNLTDTAVALSSPQP
jgi:hypothetical protein